MEIHAWAHRHAGRSDALLPVFLSLTCCCSCGGSAGPTQQVRPRSCACRGPSGPVHLAFFRLLHALLRSRGGPASPTLQLRTQVHVRMCTRMGPSRPHPALAVVRPVALGWGPGVWAPLFFFLSCARDTSRAGCSVRWLLRECLLFLHPLCFFWPVLARCSVREMIRAKVSFFLRVHFFFFSYAHLRVLTAPSLHASAGAAGSLCGVFWTVPLL